MDSYSATATQFRRICILKNQNRPACISGHTKTITVTRLPIEALFIINSPGFQDYQTDMKLVISQPSVYRHVKKCLTLSPLISKNKFPYLIPINFLYFKYYGEVINISRKFTLGDHMLNSHTHFIHTLYYYQHQVNLNKVYFRPQIAGASRGGRR